MKRLTLSVLLLAMPLAPVGWTGMTCANNNKTAYTSIGAVEQAVDLANRGYLELVVTGQTPTNSTPTVEAAFNDTKMTLLAAAVAASGGTNAPVPAVTMAKATAFTNTITAAILKK